MLLSKTHLFNPKVFIYLDIYPKIIEVLQTMATIGMMTMVAYMIFKALGSFDFNNSYIKENNEQKIAMPSYRPSKRSIGLLLVFALIGMVAQSAPSTDSIIKYYIADQITIENIDLAADGITSVTDYIGGMISDGVDKINDTIRGK